MNFMFKVVTKKFYDIFLKTVYFEYMVIILKNYSIRNIKLLSIILECPMDSG